MAILTSTGQAPAGSIWDIWRNLIYVPECERLYESTARVRIAQCGRRSGKTLLAKFIAYDKWLECEDTRAYILLCAPTLDQARDIFWEDMLEIIPNHRIYRKNETRMTIRGNHGPTLRVLGMDKAMRAEGKSSVYFAVLDEYAAMKADAWDRTIGPAIDTEGREGSALIVTTPKGRNHANRLFENAKRPDWPDYEAFHWESSAVLSADKIESKQRTMDKRSFNQEYRGIAEELEGKTYDFKRDIHAIEPMQYDPGLDLFFAFDFNKKPGVALISQRQTYQGNRQGIAPVITAWVDEVWVDDNSNTRIVCNILAQRYGPGGADHKKHVYCYGDATGGAGGSAKVEGSDTDLIPKYLKPVFGDRLHMRFPDGNPRERSRINAFNAQLESADNIVHVLIDPGCEHFIYDLDSVISKEDGSVDKEYDKMLTHMADGGGYQMAAQFPVVEEWWSVEQV